MEEKKSEQDIEVINYLSEHIFTFKDEEGNIQLGIGPEIERPEDIANELENSDFLKNFRQEAYAMNGYYSCALARLDDALMLDARKQTERIEELRDRELTPDDWEEAQDAFLILEKMLTSMINIVGAFSVAGLQRMAILKDYQRIYREEIFPKIAY